MSFWDTLQEIAEKEGMSLAKFRTTNRSGTDHQYLGSLNLPRMRPERSAYLLI
jgi:predicted DNA-binding ribbon-helix-helix protein